MFSEIDLVGLMIKIKYNLLKRRFLKPLLQDNYREITENDKRISITSEGKNILKIFKIRE